MPRAEALDRAPAGRAGGRAARALAHPRDGAGLLVRSWSGFSSVPLGFEPKGLSAALVYPREGDARRRPRRSWSKRDPSRRRARALVGDLPLDLGGRIEGQTFTIVGRTPSPQSRCWGNEFGSAPST